jgi:hypothetical protein
MSPARYRLTEDDDLVAAWVARWAPVTAMQIGRRFGRSKRTTYRRIQALLQYELLHREPRDVQNIPGLLVPGPRHAVRPPRPLFPLSLRRHLLVVDHVIGAELQDLQVLAPDEIARRDDILAQLPRDGTRSVLPGAVVLAEHRVAIYAVVGGDEAGGHPLSAVLAHRWPASLHARLVVSDERLLPDALPARVQAERAPWPALEPPG